MLTMPPKKTHKLYCYVDESGQDTMGHLFIVAIVVTDNRRNELEGLLETIEKDSGKKKRKWLKTRAKERQAYVSALATTDLPVQIYTRSYIGKVGAYDDLEVLAAAQAITLYREENHIAENYKVTIAIDGLSKNLRPRVGRSFRELGIKTRNVHGERDEASPIIRLADVIAGVVREASEDRAEYKELRALLKRYKKLREL